MSRSLAHALCTTLGLTIIAILLSVAALAPREQEAAPLIGRLATVEPALRRLAVLPDGEIKLVELQVADDCDVRQGDAEMTLPDLVIQVGRRVTVRYRVENERRIAESVIVEPK